MHFAHRLSDNTTSCQLRSEASALFCPRRPVARSRRIARRKHAFSPIRPIKKCSLRKERLHFWGVLLKYRWRVVGCGVPDAPCTARKFGAAPDACTCHCRGGDSRARHCTGGKCGPMLKRQWPPSLSLRGGRRPTRQSREGSSSSYKVPIKRQAPIASVAALTAQPLAALPPYGCGVPFTGSERLVQGN